MKAHRAVVAGLVGLLTATPAWASQETIVYEFQGRPGDGAQPLGGLTAVGGLLYGVTGVGGRFNYGTVFSVTAEGRESLVGYLNLKDNSIARPAFGVTVFGPYLYVALQGYAVSTGGLLRFPHLGGTAQILVEFNAARTADPASPVLRVNDGFFGLCQFGGLGHGHGARSAHGTLYRYGSDGHLRIVYTFEGGTDGSEPYGNLFYEGGTFFGTTLQGGSASGVGDGTVFAVTLDGQETVLHAFQGATEGSQPTGGLTQVDTTLYGTTRSGGTGGAGTVFSLAADGTFTVLHSFTGGADGGTPNGSLLNVGGTLYGTTQSGGLANDGGTIYTIGPTGTFSAVYAFPCCGARHGLHPSSGLVPLNGALYGETAEGGLRQHGTVYRYRP